MNDNAPDEPLGSLAQSARKTSLGQARGILIAIGLLTLVVNLIFYGLVDSQVKDEVKDLKAKMGPNVVIDQKVIDEAVREAKITNLAFAGLGAVFLVLGFLVYKIPVGATVTGLVLYVTGNVLAAVLLGPEVVAKGAIIKIIIVVGLVKAVQAAFAYEREAKAEADARRSSLDAGF